MVRTSVIVPCYNAEATAEHAIRSILRQTDPDLEIIAVDDGSTDETAAVLASMSDPRLRVIQHGSNRGISAARNSGLAAAQGAYLAFLDSDDAWEPDFLRRAHEARGDAQAIVCGRVVELPDGTSRTAHSTLVGTFTGEQAALGMMTGSVTPFPWDKVILRSAFDGVTYPVDIHRFEDQVVGIVVMSRIDKVVSIPEPLVRYRVGGGSLTWGRVPEVAEAERALGFLESELGAWLDTAARHRALQTCRTLFLMLTAQSAMRSSDAVAAAAVLAACRSRITMTMIWATLRRNTFYGAGAALLKCAPGTYRRLFTAYVRRQYALT